MMVIMAKATRELSGGLFSARNDIFLVVAHGATD